MATGISRSEPPAPESANAAVSRGQCPHPGIRVTEQSVGEIASWFTSFCSPDAWKEEQQRGYSAAWFRFKLQRASQGSSPLRPDRISRIRDVRRQVDLVPQPDRAWILLSLPSDAFSDPDPLVSESELVAQ